jgi:hypothetical protein
MISSVKYSVDKDGMITLIDKNGTEVATMNMQ